MHILVVWGEPPGPPHSIRAIRHEILVSCFAWNFFESTATVAISTSAMTAREPVGNSGVVEDVLVTDVVVEALTLDDVVEVDEEVVEMDDEVEADEVVVEADDVVT